LPNFRAEASEFANQFWPEIQIFWLPILNELPKAGLKIIDKIH
jgi:hypothetical protein